ncbi:hypothetical protein QO002_005305 [Pararhizobium capsulatum DSM 1112]|uniref:Uncharacterized protein n=1 Tax=Pararhizobium capsulatum DSM 1112 TaxID=1121113 RepID=A0ABU0BXV3_9HYPH|nr:hypothetical protein [Pararhizobium capsulatum DSM 1112]
MDTVRVTARFALIDVLSCRRGMSNSGLVSRIAGNAIGADAYLPNMGTEDFLFCLSRQSLEASCKETFILPCSRVRETRAALVDHYKDGHFVHPTALFASDAKELADLLKQGEIVEDGGTEIEEASGVPSETEQPDGDAIGEEHGDDPDTGGGDETSDEEVTAYGVAAE